MGRALLIPIMMPNDVFGMTRVGQCARIDSASASASSQLFVCPGPTWENADWRLGTGDHWTRLIRGEAGKDGQLVNNTAFLGTGRFVCVRQTCCTASQ